ncbi:MAG: LysM peptidoglycan-binding domain-containing protein [Pirellulales bacterium]|nr:LysM peptidoglycan-binding domain-containing protein [Pirellulales bacterium]
MESLKPILLCIVLSGIGYLVYVALNRAQPLEPALDAAPPWSQAAASETAKSSGEGRVGATLGSGGLVTPPVVEPPRSNATKSSLPFGDGHSLVTPPSTSSVSSLPSQPPISPPSFAPPTTASLPSAPPAPSLINPIQPPPSQSAGGNPLVGAAEMPTERGPAVPAPSATVNLETARQRHEFESAMRQAQSDIQQNKLVDALRELSPWYDHAAVPVEQQAALDDLLSQLAGTVIYSREHFLQQPRVVQAGETLDLIAESLQVPWQLLAKINGIDDPKSIVVGEQLKIVRGPFDARLNRSHNQLAIFVDNLYAGRFDVQVSGDVAQVDGTFPVTKFSADNPSNSQGQKYISLGGNLFLRLNDGSPLSQPGTMQIGRQDFDDVFDILSDRSRVTIRR